MTNIAKIKNVIKRKVNEQRLRNVVGDILDASLPNILAEVDQLDQAFLDAKPVKEEEELEELDVRKTHGDKRIENPATGNDIKLRTALKAKKGSAVYAKGLSMYNALKDTPANESVKGKLERLKELLGTDVNERAYASTDGKPTFDYDPGEGKLTEAKGFSIINKARAKAALRQIKSGKRDDGMGKFTSELFGFKKLDNTPYKITDSKDLNKYDKFGLGEGKLTEAKIRKGDVIKMDDGEIGVVNKVSGRVAYIKLPSMPGSFHPIEAARVTYKGKHKGKDIYSETKGAPKGHYFTASGNVVKGNLSKAAKSKGARLSDPKDKQRSKVPKATQVNEAEEYKYKKYVAKAFKDIKDATFNFRNAMGVKQLGQSDPKVKKQLESLHKALFALEKDFKGKGLTEGEINEDRFGHPITAQGNQTYIQLEKLIKMLSGKEKRDAEKAFRAMWSKIKTAMEEEEQK